MGASETISAAARLDAARGLLTVCCEAPCYEQSECVLDGQRYGRCKSCKEMAELFQWGEEQP